MRFKYLFQTLFMFPKKKKEKLHLEHIHQKLIHEKLGLMKKRQPLAMNKLLT